MRNLTYLLLLAAVLSLALNACGQTPSPTVMPTKAAPATISPALTTVPPTITAAPPTPAITLPAPTLTTLPEGKTIAVNSVADSGPGTLRQAILDSMPGDTIIFDARVFPPDRPTTLYLENEDEDSALPNISNGGVTVDASNAGVILDGSKLKGDTVNGLEVYSDRNTVMGLQLVHFSGSGIVVCGGSYNRIGGDRSTGAGPLGQGNLVGSDNIGIDLCSQGTFNNFVVGNLIGTDPSGMVDLGNTFCGICIEDGVRSTTIGPDNIIAYNHVDGILIDGPDAFGNIMTHNKIYQNLGSDIKLDHGSNAALSNPSIADWEAASGTITGQACPDCVVEIYSGIRGEAEFYEGRTIADLSGGFHFAKGSAFSGFRLRVTATDRSGNTSQYSSTVTMPVPKGNTILVNSAGNSGPGTLRQALLDVRNGDTITFNPQIFPPDHPATIRLKNEDEDSALPPLDKDGVTIDASNAGVILDGSALQGDWIIGLEIYSDWNTIEGLQIVHFSGQGLVISNGSHNRIGGERGIGAGPLGQGNLISANSIGIEVRGTGATFNTISGNLIGTDPTGTYQLAGNNFWITNEWGNLEGGFQIDDGSSQNTIGPDNIIATNHSFGMKITGEISSRNTILQNSIHDNGGEGIQIENHGNGGLAVPMLTDLDLTVGRVSGTACANCKVEIFSDGAGEGRFFEGWTTADGMGGFSFSKDALLRGPRVTATATDFAGNTSQFSSSLGAAAGIQMANNQPRIPIQTRTSGELADNRMGSHWSSLLLVPYPDDMLNLNLDLGVKRFRTSINNLDTNNVDAFLDQSEFSIDPVYDDFITQLADNDVRVTYVLSFWDKRLQSSGGKLITPRFQTEDQIQAYLDYVRFIVHHFKDRVHYYEIWNEPSLSSFPMQWIRVNDYINLVKRTIPIIHQEDPLAKIVVGSTHGLTDQDSQNYLFSILDSDIMPLVNVVAWHPMYGSSPEYDAASRQYYYAYPSLVQKIKSTAATQGFTGEFEADELAWHSPEDALPRDSWSGASSEIKAAKYMARGILMNLGLNVSITQQDNGNTRRPPLVYSTIKNLDTIMAGNQTNDLHIAIQSDAIHTKSYSFSMPNGDNLLAVWNDGAAVDNDAGMPSALTISGFAGWKATGIDVLNGFEQELITSGENGDLVLQGFLLKDYPIIIRLSK